MEKSDPVEVDVAYPPIEWTPPKLAEVFQGLFIQVLPSVAIAIGAVIWRVKVGGAIAIPNQLVALFILSLLVFAGAARSVLISRQQPTIEFVLIGFKPRPRAFVLSGLIIVWAAFVVLTH